MPAPLTAITAAVVGVILSLALFFAMHVFMHNQSTMPQSTMQVDWLALILAIVGFIALFRFKVSIIKLIFVYALIGLLLSFI